MVCQLTLRMQPRRRKFKMILDGCEGAMGLLFRNEKACLIQEADEAFYVNDKARCVDAIERLYDLFDNDME